MLQQQQQRSAVYSFHKRSLSQTLSLQRVAAIPRLNSPFRQVTPAPLAPASYTHCTDHGLPHAGASEPSCVLTCAPMLLQTAAALRHCQTDPLQSTTAAAAAPVQCSDPGTHAACCTQLHKQNIDMVFHNDSAQSMWRGRQKRHASCAKCTPKQNAPIPAAQMLTNPFQIRFKT